MPLENSIQRKLAARWVSDLITRFRTPRQHRLCLQLARESDGAALLAKLHERLEFGLLTRDDLTSVLQEFLKRSSLEARLPWNRFFSALPEDHLPRLHQVYACLGQFERAADLAQAGGDLTSAFAYSVQIPGLDSGWRSLDLAKIVNDPKLIAQANAKLAEDLCAQGKLAEAISHFEQAGRLERASDCHLQLRNFAAAVGTRPAVEAHWIAAFRKAVEEAIGANIAAKDFIAAASALKQLQVAWNGKGAQDLALAEADRAGLLLLEVVKTARAAFGDELRGSHAQPGAELFKRWSRFEEAAGNYLEAAVQAEMARDYFAASLLFEQAGAFGQALSALDQSKDSHDAKRRAELLERGGDYFMAALVYERIGDKDKAVSMFEQSGEYGRATNLRRSLLSGPEAAFDGRLFELLKRANRMESLAELCLQLASSPATGAADRTQFLRRVKTLADLDLIPRSWLDRVGLDLQRAEGAPKAAFQERAGQWLAQATTQVLQSYLEVFGMDLGTSNSAVALFNKTAGEPQVVEWRGRRTFSSIFAIDGKGREIVGLPESELMGKSPRAILTRAKRVLGTSHRFKAEGQLLRAEEVSARIIQHGRAIALECLGNKIIERTCQLAAKAIGSPVPGDWVKEYFDGHPPAIVLNQAVITVPAFFNDAQKQATRAAAALAGISIQRLIHEPTAACLAQRTKGDQDATVLVVDLGAGTLDLSLVSLGEGVYEVAEIEGDNLLGSSDLDELLFNHFLQFAKQQTGDDSVEKGLARRRLRQACEDLKIELSSRPAASVKLPNLVDAQTMELAMQREQFERMCEPWLKRIETACRKIKGKPDRVLLIGGGALMPAVRRCVKEVFHLEPSPGADPLTAVARGAAIQAAILSGLLKDLLVLDAVPFSLGIKSFDQQKTAHLDVLIRKHATIPSEVKKVYTTMTDNQPAVTIEVFQGEDPVPGKNFKIGQFHLEGIPPAKAGVPQIEVTFGIDASCLLAITARDLGTHKERKIRIADSHLLTPAQLKDLEQHLQTARGRQEVIEKLEKIASLLTAFRADPTGVGLPELQRQFQQALAGYETHARRFAPGPSDEQVMLEIYRERNELESRVRLALDRWQTLRQSAEAWLAAVGKLSLETGGAHPQNAQVLEGEDLARRAKDAGRALADVAAIYRQWLNVLGGLPVSPDGEPEELARHFLRAGRWDEALVHFLRLEPPSSRPQIEMGLEILARLRRRGEYAAVLRKHAELLGVQSPDFVRPNETVRLYVSSVAWIRVPSGAGSGFAIGPSQVATNRHVIIDPATGKPLLPSQVTIVSLHGETRVRSIHLSKTSGDDVAILDLESQDGLVPLRLGFAELVEVGERIVTIGFPAPGAGGFQENLFCNTGLVNRIRPSEQCSERVLEVSIELQGGISGAPILNELGEVVGMVTFAQMRGRAVLGGQIHFERSFFAIPVSVLRRVVAERPTLPG